MQGLKLSLRERRLELQADIRNALRTGLHALCDQQFLGRDSADLELANLSTICTRRDLRRMFKLGDNLPRFPDEMLSGIRQPDVSPGSVKELYTKFVFDKAKL